MECYICALGEISGIVEYLGNEDPIGFILLSIYKPDLPKDSVPLIKIKCLDVMRGEDGFIDEDQIEELYKFIKSYWYLDKWIVSCDAGISRSPATAMAVMEFLGCDEIAEGIRSMYKFYNPDIYSEIINKFKELEEKRKSI